MLLTTTAEPTPAILDLEQAIDDFRATVTPLLDPTPAEQWDGVKLQEQERAILLAGLRLVGHCIAILISTLVLTESVKVAASLRAKGVSPYFCSNRSQIYRLNSNGRHFYLHSGGFPVVFGHLMGQNQA